MVWAMLTKLRARRKRGLRAKGKAPVRDKAKRRRAHPRPRPLYLPHIVFALSAVATALIVLLTLFGQRGLMEVYALSQKIRATSEEIALYEQKNKALQDRIENLKHDPYTIEQIAREELGLVKPGETVYEFVDEPPSPLPRK
ncbi:MAG: septum formation initiator family protein [Candidatus Tectimicrobiota bacterium]